jgi:hypothetical protein
MSVGKCTPSITLETPTSTAHGNRINAATGTNQDIMIAIRNAAEVCPDGKLNWSEGITADLKFGIACGGRLRLKNFLATV